MSEIPAPTDNSSVGAPTDRVRLTVVLPTLDEAHQIAEAVRALDWADEVVVVDGGSADGTAELARGAGARVIVLAGETIGAQRNAGIAAARNTWVLALDADERATPMLREEIRRILRAPDRDAYELRFRSFFLGRELRHGAYSADWHIRLFTSVRRYSRSRVHEALEPIASVGRLEGPVDHVPFRDLNHYIRKVVKYARWGADDLAARGRRVSVLDVAGRPVWRFFRDYVLYAGFLDGFPGFLVAAFAGVGTLIKYSLRFSEQDG